MTAAATQLRAVGTVFLLKRPLIVAPGVVTGVTLLVLADIPRLQLAALGTGMASMFGFFCVEAWIGRKREVSARWLSWSLRITVTALTYACAVSGGLRSPFLPLTLAPVVVAFAAFGRRRPSATMAAYSAVLVGTLALLPTGWPWPRIPSPYDVAITAVASIITLALAYVGVAQLGDALVSSRETLLRMREAALLSTTSRLKSLETIGSKVAHELKNPLASIKGLAQLSARGPEDRRTAQRFEVLLAAVRHMEEVLDDYLSFARPLDDVRLEPIDLDALVDEALDLVEVRAEAAEITLTRSGHAGTVQGDRQRLLEALLNVLTNAVEASAAGDHVRVSLSRGDGRAGVEVHDQGPGLSGPDLQRLGTPYFTTKPEGTGLGVVIAMAAVRQHGGELDFDSAHGQGTRVRIALPTTSKKEQADAACAGGG